MGVKREASLISEDQESSKSLAHDLVDLGRDAHAIANSSDSSTNSDTMSAKPTLVRSQSNSGAAGMMMPQLAWQTSTGGTRM